MTFKEKFLEWWIRPEGYHACEEVSSQLRNKI